MNLGFDCASSLTLAATKLFKEDGKAFVCRYLVPSGWKMLTRKEAEAISMGGLTIVSVFETTADRAKGGYDAGYSDGLVAASCAKAIGQPPDSTIYFAVDFEANGVQLGMVTDYIRGASQATPDYKTGVYGSYAVVKACQSTGVCSHYWQTLAWSYGKKADGIHIYQCDNGPTGEGQTIHGINVDLNQGYGDEGGWHLMEFKDVAATHWAHDLIVKVTDAGIMHGYPDGTFKPDEPLTRAELAAVVAKIKGLV